MRGISRLVVLQRGIVSCAPRHVSRRRRARGVDRASAPWPQVGSHTRRDRRAIICRARRRAQETVPGALPRLGLARRPPASHGQDAAHCRAVLSHVRSSSNARSSRRCSSKRPRRSSKSAACCRVRRSSSSSGARYRARSRPASVRSWRCRRWATSGARCERRRALVHAPVAVGGWRVPSASGRSCPACGARRGFHRSGSGAAVGQYAPLYPLHR